MNRTIRRRALTATAALVCALGLASCSDDSGSDSGDGDSGTTTVAVTHAFGTTEVPSNPEHALSFSQTWTDAFAELGSPVATQVVNDQFADGQPWDTEGTEGTDVAGTTVPVSVTSADLVTTLGMEAIAEQDPDVIFAGFLPDQATYDALSDIAPTVATVGEGKVDDWRAVTTAAGEILGKSDEAEEKIGEVDDAMAQVKETYPALEGATFAYAAYRAQSFTVITSPQDASNTFFADLGMTQATDRITGTESGRGIAVSAENLDLLDMDLLVLWISGETPDDLPGWSDLPSVKNGSAAQLQTVAATGLGAPTVRSVPWVLDEMDPYFAALQEADGE
ncbi:ABC transporter substrate-binding protein [Corynebacterium variabile]|uniref:ABC-type Fe3+-hydroxamate transport system, periplasmic component n=3 Tax=Corynebacterium variabile TaxID=1727 RepID=A0A0X2NLV5_9CORY|nr:ABC transporter substrate-binding protein [Corynebacterium variabile]CUU65718.1 ABC-type Fe3+-hydroxamate transport system, periplasmic component [Corynebacterium variabile]